MTGEIIQRCNSFEGILPWVQFKSLWNWCNTIDFLSEIKDTSCIFIQFNKFFFPFIANSRSYLVHTWGIVNKKKTLLLEQKSFPLNYRVVSLSILQFIGVFPKWNRNSMNSAIPGNLINHWSMNWSRFKDPVSHMCLAGSVVASWFSTQETAGLNPFTVSSYFCDCIQFASFSCPVINAERYLHLI